MRNHVAARSREPWRRLVNGNGVETAIRARIAGGELVIDRSPEGDGTCPNDSLLAAEGTSVDGEPALGVLTIEGGEHVELIRDRQFFDYLQVELERTWASVAARPAAAKVG